MEATRGLAAIEVREVRKGEVGERGTVVRGKERERGLWWWPCLCWIESEIEVESKSKMKRMELERAM